MMNSRKTATLLQLSITCGNKLYCKQEDLMQQDNKEKEGKQGTRKTADIL